MIPPLFCPHKHSGLCRSICACVSLALLQWQWAIIRALCSWQQHSGPRIWLLSGKPGARSSSQSHWTHRRRGGASHAPCAMIGALFQGARRLADWQRGMQWKRAIGRGEGEQWGMEGKKKGKTSGCCLLLFLDNRFVCSFTFSFGGHLMRSGW